MTKRKNATKNTEEDKKDMNDKMTDIRFATNDFELKPGRWTSKSWRIFFCLGKKLGKFGW